VAQTYRVDAQWDNEACVWVFTSRDVPGLVTSGLEKDEIIHKLRLIIPALTGIGVEPDDDIQIRFSLEGQSLPKEATKPVQGDTMMVRLAA
jgi:hypothetical protein